MNQPASKAETGKKQKYHVNKQTNPQPTHSYCSVLCFVPCSGISRAIRLTVTVVFTVPTDSFSCVKWLLKAAAELQRTWRTPSSQWLS